MNAAAERRLSAPLALIVVLLGALLLALFAGLGRQVHWLPPRPAAPLAAHRDAAKLPAPLPLQQFAQVWQHPLFNPDRKPISHTAGANTNLGDMQLTGIIITPGLRMALLRNKSGDKEIRVREGAALPDGSWTLSELRPRSALFDSGGGRTELKLPAGAPIDSPRGEGKTSSSDDQPGAHLEPMPGADQRNGEPAAGASPTLWTTNASASGENAKPDEIDPDDAPESGSKLDDGNSPDNQAAPDADASSSSSMLPGAGMHPVSTPAPDSPPADAQQTARIRQLKATILKRRAEAAAHEGDR